MKHDEVASYLALSPEHLSRVIHRLTERGIIEQRKGWMFLLRRET